MDEQSRPADLLAKHQGILLRMSFRISIYYAILAGA